MDFRPSRAITIQLQEEQRCQLAAPETIRAACLRPEVLAFDILHEGRLVGFAQLRQFDAGAWFLWNYAIDKFCQGQGLGRTALMDLIALMKARHGLRLLTTTYLFGNEAAQRLYEGLGFVETGVVAEEGCHEVNMELLVEDVWT